MAVGLFAGLLIVVLVIDFCRPELGCRDDLRFYAQALLFELSGDALGHFLLVYILVEHGRAILRADVRALTVQLGKIVNFIEELGELFEGDYLGIIIHFNGLSMTGLAGADLFVGGLILTAAHVADNGCQYAWVLFEMVLHAPKATCRKDCTFNRRLFKGREFQGN